MNTNRIETAAGLHAFNCSDNTFTIVADKEKRYQVFDESGRPVPKEWGKMNAQLASYFCK